MTTRLELYNDALLLCGSGLLSSLTEEGERRRLLDHVWDSGWVDGCLEAGYWKFAMRTLRLDYEVSVTPQFGYSRAFLKPDDWIRPYAICEDEYFENPLLRYQDDGQYLFADLDSIYVRFVSNHTTKGGDLSLWTSAFTEYAAAFGASGIIHKLTADKEKIIMLIKPRSGILAQALQAAKSLDAMQEGTKFPPPGSWQLARGGRRGGGPLGDGGTSGSLIG